MLIAAAAGAVFTWLAWPGFMSYDSVFALSQARDGITTGTYPPMVSYLWRLLELAVPGQGAMLAVEVVLLFVAGALCVFAMSRSLLAVVAYCMCLMLLPAFAGPLMMVWKDVLFAGSLILTTYVAWSLAGTSPRTHPGRWLVCAGLLILTASFRLNGLPALLPAIYLTADALLPAATLRKRLVAMLAGALLTALAVFVLSSWRLPDLQRIPGSTTHRYVMFHDLLGISSCLGVQVFSPGISGGRTYDAPRLRAMYHPEHVQKSFSGADAPGEGGLVALREEDWIREVVHHPRCYLDHKLNVMAYMLGYNRGSVFYVTDPGIFPNDMDLQAPDAGRIGPILDRVLRNAASPMARPITYLLLAVAALLAMRARGLDLRLPLALLTSSMLYLAVGILLLSGADLRYQYAEACQWLVIAIGGGTAAARSTLADRIRR